MLQEGYLLLCLVLSGRAEKVQEFQGPQPMHDTISYWIKMVTAHSNKSFVPEA